MRLAIADPPYPPMFSERRDREGGPLRVTSRSRARRWYGDGPRSTTDSPAADFHPEAGTWDDLTEHRRLLERLVDEFDGWAIATTPDGLGAYHPLPIAARIMAWHRPTAMPGGGRLMSRWEPVIVLIPEERRGRAGMRVSDVLTANPPTAGFVGAKPPEWTRWVLDALGYEPATDELVDLFPGSGSVAAAADGMLALAGAHHNPREERP
ncbi:hypothetical protein [Microbacterium lacus]|uniref:hypothetical protein n=1 Tax=Microbacterium lacus TaxID=415217 RepID=UPI000C2B69F6|nr:hypothetical protein [Microbacterium lacus]